MKRIFSEECATTVGTLIGPTCILCLFCCLGLKSVWDAAVNFIEEKESRVRVEIQPVNGEDYKVWRWLTPASNPGTPITG